MASNLEALILKLYSIGAVKFGKFTLKSGIESPVYFDLRVIISYPDVMKQVSVFLWKAVEEAGCQFDNVCGVPYTALPLATLISADHNVPMLIRRKEAKDYGTKKIVEGHYTAGQRCLVVEDVVTSGSSVLDTVKVLGDCELKVTDAVVLLDREQGGRDALRHKGINMHSICGLSQLLTILHSVGQVSDQIVEEVKEFIKQNSFSPEPCVAQKEENSNSIPSKKAKKSLTYAQRAQLCSHPVSKKLFTIMEEKKTNLAFSVDVTKTDQILKLADVVGPYICVLKTHVDIIEDFSLSFISQLVKLAEKHNFLIFEDRKFADIGNTVQLQYKSGIHHIVDWSDMVNAHLLPGAAIIDGLKKVGGEKRRGCLLIAEMSSEGCLINKDYTKECVRIAEDEDFVIGFICQSAVSTDPTLVHMTPGVRLSGGGDSLGQQYATPQSVIGEKNCDVIIVGRGILTAEDPGKTAQTYQHAGYEAYRKRVEG